VAVDQLASKGGSPSGGLGLYDLRLELAQSFAQAEDNPLA
jgi:hypothetical protein